jgi:hypothetical protein
MESEDGKDEQTPAKVQQGKGALGKGSSDEGGKRGVEKDEW